MYLQRSTRTVDVLEGGEPEAALRRRVVGFRPDRTNLIQGSGPRLLKDTDLVEDSATPRWPSKAPRLGRLVKKINLFQTIAFIVCVLFGLGLIANTEASNDGSWFWYSVFFNSGKRLYADMHLALQPLYVLETSAFMAVLGKGWLVSRIPAVLHLFAYCLALLLLVRKSSLSDAGKAVLLAFSFFVSITFGAYVFGDYHVLTDCFVLYSLVTLLSLRTSSSVGRTLGLAAILGALSGLALTTRVNDGAALFAGVVLAIVCLAPSKKLLSLLVFGLATGFTVVLVVHLTGDSLRDYAMYTVIKAAGIKGDAGGSILLQPLRLPLNTAGWLNYSWYGLRDRYLTAAVTGALILALVFLPLRRKIGWWQLGLAVLGTALVAALANRAGLFKDNGLNLCLVSFVVLLAYGLGIVVAARLISSIIHPTRANTWDRRQILLLIPLGQMASGSMSAGGMHFCLYGPVCFFIVVLAICFPRNLNPEWQQLRLPWNTLERLVHSWFLRVRSHLLAFVQALNSVSALPAITRRHKWWEPGLAVFGAVLIGLIGPPFHIPQAGLFVDDALLPLAGFLIILACALGIWAVARFIFWLVDGNPSTGWERREFLLLIPLGQMVVGSLFCGIYGSEAFFVAVDVFVVVLGFFSAIKMKASLPRDSLFALAIVLIMCAVAFRFNSPYSWYTYREKPMFADRVWYRSPDHGPMIIERGLLRMILPVCEKTRGSGGDSELLSVPFPTANYFCAIPPWHGYVQTFFDTASPQTIQNLMDELQHSPPKWIFYQRQLRTLRFHEVVFNQGNPLAQRYLGQFIERRVGEGTWRIVYNSDFGESTLGSANFVPQWDNQWVLIQTR